MVMFSQVMLTLWEMLVSRNRIGVVAASTRTWGQKGTALCTGRGSISERCEKKDRFSENQVRPRNFCFYWNCTLENYFPLSKLLLNNMLKELLNWE